MTGNDNWSELTKHHIVPYMYSKWLPIEYKSHNSHDIVLLTRDEHYRYEIEATKLKNLIAKKLNILTLHEYSRKMNQKSSYIGMANAILSYNVKL